MNNQEINNQMEKPLISLVSIVKDEEEILMNMINSVKDIVNEFIIVDTGSTDRTKEIIAQFGKVHEIPFVNFVDTKNEALKLATGKYILFMDADERIISGGEKLIEYAKEGLHSISGRIEEGAAGDDSSVANAYNRMRLWKNDGTWHFEGPGVHEYVMGTGSIIVDNSIRVRHEHLKSNKGATQTQRFSKYVELLKAAIDKDPLDSRAWFYLGRTYKDLGLGLSAIQAFETYLNIPNNTFLDERWQAAYDIGLCWKMQGEYDKAMEAFQRSIDIDPRRAESFNQIGYIHHNMGSFTLAALAFEKAYSMPIPDNVILFLNPLDYKETPADNAVLSHFKAKNFKRAEEFAVNLVQMLPIQKLDKRVTENVWWCKTKTCQKIFLALGHTPEPVWGGMMETTGVHGVETTYLELSKEFAKMGHDVFLFCETKEEHKYEGVYYIPWQNYKDYVAITPDVVITTRWFDAIYIEAGKKIIWLQDAHFADPNHPDAFSVANHIVCSSKWHRQYIAERFRDTIDFKKIKIIPLGTEKIWFNSVLPKKKLKVIYASNPDRGLYILGDMWERLLKEIPGIELHIAYGWEGLKTWNKSQEWSNKIEAEKRALYDKFGSNINKNVFFKGRLTHKELAKEMLTSELCLYPNNFWETFCLVALECQAAGTPLITTDMGALKTTLNPACNVLIQDDPFSQGYAEKFIKATKELLITDREKLTSYSAAGRSFVMNSATDWNDISAIWQTLIWE